MNWLRASFAALIRLCKSGVRGCFHRFRSIYGAGSDTAQIMSQKPKPSLPPRLALETIIHKRAVRTCNREPQAVAKYVRTHTILSSRAFSDQ